MTDLVKPREVEVVYETEEPVKYAVEDRVAWITMNRPGFNNARTAR